MQSGLNKSVREYIRGGHKILVPPNNLPQNFISGGGYFFAAKTGDGKTLWHKLSNYVFNRQSFDFKQSLIRVIKKEFFL